MGFKKRDIVIFFAGAEAFHTFIHILAAFLFKFPVAMKGWHFNATLNAWAIVINAVITVGLFWWARRLSKWKMF